MKNRGDQGLRKRTLAIGLGLFGAVAAVTADAAKLDETLIVPPRPSSPGTTFALLLTGDGGWAELIRTVGSGMTNAGIPAVGWNSRSYYWKRRTPDEAAKDLAFLMARFRKEWDRSRVVLIGYSMGADVLPFLISRLPESERQTIDLIVLLGPGRAVDFEFHLGNYLGGSLPKTALPVPSELAKLKGLPLLVLYADGDKNTCGADLPRDLGEIHALPGSHHFGGHYEELTRQILDSLQKQRQKAVPAGSSRPPS